jgi:hypothetical protein
MQTAKMGVCWTSYVRVAEADYRKLRAALWPGQVGVTMETPKLEAITLELQLDWDRIGVMFATFGLACGGVATVVYSVGFLIQALSHHV